MISDKNVANQDQNQSQLIENIKLEISPSNSLLGLSSKLIDELAIEHGYHFKDLDDAFGPALSRAKAEIDLSYIGLFNNVESIGITERVEKGPKLTQEYISLIEKQIKKEKLSFEIADTKFWAIRRSVKTLGYVAYSLLNSEKIGQDLDLFFKNLSVLLSHPMHLYKKSRDAVDHPAFNSKECFKPKEVIGNSKSMAAVLNMAYKVLNSSATVLILGESGVGKERVAQAIHAYGNRKDKPLVSLNCAAFPHDLIESELFGHTKGAFTGATEDRKGRVELAGGGTLFLDEIAELSLEAQAKLLRFLQDKVVLPVGGHKPKQVDVRIVAATNHDLEKLVEDKKFRLDLFYRLNVFPMRIPALRERKEDILPLTDHFVKIYAKEMDKEINRLSTSAIDALMNYHWPGNVRELANVIERAVILSDDGVLQGSDLPPSLRMPETDEDVKADFHLESHINQIEKDLIIDGLKSFKGNMAKAARHFGMTERKFSFRVKKYGISLKLFK
ncbi:MAG: sigma-54 interaction domain-containing protein [Bacteriovoracaceae bacterium]